MSRRMSAGIVGWGRHIDANQGLVRLDRDDAGRVYTLYGIVAAAVVKQFQNRTDAAVRFPITRSGLGESRTPTSSRTSAPKTDASAIPPRGQGGDRVNQSAVDELSGARGDLPRGGLRA